MTTQLIATILVTFALGWATGALVKDQRIERLRRRAEDAEAERHDAVADRGNWTAAAHINESACNQWRERCERREQVITMLIDENRVLQDAASRSLPRLSSVAPVVAMPEKKARARKAVRP